MIACLVAVERSKGIGFKNSMPWPRLKGDMQWFKDTTTGHIIVMGSATWKSVGLLPNRINVVISSNLYVNANHTYTDPVEAIKDLQKRYQKKNIYVVGGQKVYDSVKELIETFYVTEIDANYECDRFFDLDFVKENFLNEREVLMFDETDTTPAYSIKEYTK